MAADVYIVEEVEPLKDVEVYCWLDRGFRASHVMDNSPPCHQRANFTDFSRELVSSFRFPVCMLYKQNMKESC